MMLADMAPVKLERTNTGERKRGGSVVSREKIKEWLRDSVVEIVKDLRESPLLVHLYAEANGGLSTTAKNPEAEDWKTMVGRWGRGDKRTPEGVIFVENGLWTDLLPTENDPGRSGMGTVCTHFCLVKMKSFRETALSQLNNSWLVQTGQ
ncbi:hypothetical protein N665_2565s0001 [Sinapis alba]|nr:hypothetical protein N665_2565s0001 [Sinapis alba]